MDAKSANFLKFLEGNKQFSIPIYQRPYSWTRKQCRQLWEDIVRAATNPNIAGHFIGSVVYITEGLYQASSINTLLVIDGQQRMTTLSLLLAALRKPVTDSHDENGISKEAIDDFYLFNRYGKGDQRYRLVLTQNDRETFLRLIENRELPKQESARLVENYRFFEEQIAASKLNPQTIYQGVSKLIIVDVALERGRDNPQLIFESLNSTGLDLSQADLIRNYVLMGLPPEQQSQLYSDYWYPMEQSFGGADNVGYFDRFIRDYLTVKSQKGEIPNIRDVYEVFKAHVRETPNATVNERVAEIYRYSKHFVRIAFPNEEEEISDILIDINTLRVDVAYPFLLEVFDDYQKTFINRDEVIQILRLVANYVFRRAICEIPTNSLNKTFATLTRSKFFDKKRYLESVQATFLTKDSYRRFPDDEEFKQDLMVKDVYHFRNRKYLLEKLENQSHPKEPIDADEYTTEHILPQNPELPTLWQKELGPNWKQ
ncbi:MAG: DUF262 domain-containing protein, partial [Chloroflexota bacterium]|nr:DUF262 domain-containing protein [Chloroflexota bacterium]